MLFEMGSHAYIIESNRAIREVEVLNRLGDFYTIRFLDSGGGIKVRGSRLYATRESAEETIPVKKEKPKTGYRSPYDYWH